MAFPVFVPDELVVPPPSDHIQNNLVKHLQMKDNVFSSFEYLPIQDSFILQHLRKKKGKEVVDFIMVVTFQETEASSKDGTAMDVIKKGICYEGSCYRFLGHTDSQLSTKTCYLMHDSELAIYDYFQTFADFNAISSVSKRSEYIGNLFVGFDRHMSLKENDYFVIDDIKKGRHSFTNGCGYMNMQLATEVKQLENLQYIPSIVKIVYQGFFGTLVARTDLNFVKVEFRNSMKKFSSQNRDLLTNMTSLGILDYSRPYTNGYLGCKDVMLLVDRGIQRDYLSQLQDEYYSLLDNLCTSKSQAAYYLETSGHNDLLKLLNNEGFPSVKEKMLKLREEEMKKIRGEDLKVEAAYNNRSILRILVPKSRVVMAASDPYSLLDYGECYFNPTLSKQEERDFAEVDKVVVFRQSSYYSGDVLVLRLVRKNKDYEHLKDCIIFPTKGGNPHALECGGGDLARDKFFVTWDLNLIPKWHAAPFPYGPSTIAHLGGRIYEQGLQLRFRDRAKEYMNTMFGYPDNYAKQMKMTQRQELAQYFANYDANLISRFDSIFMKYASALGPSCKQCLHLHHAYFRSASILGKGEDLERVIANYEAEYKELLRPETKPKRCCLVNRLVKYGWLKPFFDPGDDVWNIMERRAITFVQQLEKLQEEGAGK
ncbi:probable RNA-dependent RNA polymerase 1 [Exaiptasia diaphana]|uniref:RNA-dependent RNA polymerase n=1 Tax=Exaiptasia diaphana TaxID=2652724 RepID=A0A913YWT7_EXADI|nr:probable RNA-dependent RNA polymerase 1 [Exaiptasia diaphana]